MSERVVLVTGASAGFGQACVQHLGQQGHRVYGTSRRAEFSAVGQAPTVPVMIPMDVRDDASVRTAVAHVLEREGRLDVVVNNAGVGLAGAVEDSSLSEAKALFETNFFGLLRVCHQAVPVMRDQGSGLIINIGSIGGPVAIPFQSMYSASKNAVAALTQSLRMEARPFGVRVTLVEPGDFKTQFTSSRVFSAASQTNPAYRKRCRLAIGVMERDEQAGADPADLARLVSRLIAHPSPAPHYRVGMIFQRLAAALRPLLPARIFERAITRYYEI